MIRRILSLVIALVATILGYLAFWTGGTTYAYRMFAFRQTETDFGALALLLLGLILLAVAVLTVALSSLGVIVVGAAHLIVGLVSIASPFQLMSGPAPITYQMFNELLGRNEAINYGFYTSVPTGVGVSVGVILLVAGIAARGRTGAINPVGRIVSPFVAVFLGIGGLLLVLSQGAVVYINQMQRASWDGNPLVIMILVLGLILLAVAVLPVRWSSAGLLVLGGILTIFGVVALFQPIALQEALRPISLELASGFLNWSGSGNIVLIGIVLLAAGFGVRTRGRRRLLTTVAPAEAPVAGPYGTVAT